MKLILGTFFVFAVNLTGIVPSIAQISKIPLLEKELKNTSRGPHFVDLLNELSFEYYSPDPVKSRDLADRALQMAEDLKYHEGVAVSYRNIGNFYWNQGDYDKALDYNFKSLKMLEENEGSTREIARTYNSIALVYRGLNNYKPALEFFNKSLKVFSALQDTERIGILYNNIGSVFVRQGKPREALVNLLKANKLFKQIGDQHRLGTNLNNIGYLFLQEKNSKAALDYLSRAYKIDSLLNDKSRMALNLNGMAQAYKLKRDYSTSIELHKQALSIAEEIGIKEEIKNAYKGIAATYAEANDYERAYTFFEKYQALNDKMLNEQILENKRKIESLYESERKQAEIDLLIKDTQLQNTELQKEKLIKNTLIGAFIALSLIALMLFIGIAQKHKINTRLETQKSEIQMKNEDLTLKNLEITRQKDEITAHVNDIRYKSEELEKALSEINQQKEALMQLNATKDKFFSIVAHDIKSPLDSLSAFASLLANYLENMSKEEIKVIATNLDQSVKNTLNLTENLLTWARSQMNNLNYDPVIINIYDIIEQKIGLFKLIAANKKIEIETDLCPDIMLLADENHFRFVLRNLISNALKFTMPNGKVIIKCKDMEDYAEISVTDDGVGISPEVLPKIFRIDTKISTRGTAGEKGTGLGLLLCKEFVEKNGGKIKVESEVAKGSKFSFTVKKAEVFELNT